MAQVLRGLPGGPPVFMTDVATTMGGAVLVADLTGEIEVVQPGTKH
jgi:hypothetical protein